MHVFLAKLINEIIKLILTKGAFLPLLFSMDIRRKISPKRCQFLVINSSSSEIALIGNGPSPSAFIVFFTLIMPDFPGDFSLLVNLYSTDFLV